jgi:formylglycine-generating enzyme required for sulfatase activity
MVLIYIPAGEFLMGSKQGAPGASTDQYPQRAVYLDAYWIDQHEVTNAQYAKCVAARKCQLPLITKSMNGSSYYGTAEFANYPLVYVLWNDARTYCAWAGRRLPTEAEWEKAARGTDGRLYPWGNQRPNCRLANYGYGVDNYCEGAPTQVGKYSPDGDSPYSVWDMAGNAFEWVADWYQSDYYSISPTRNPVGPYSGQSRVLRGDSWGYSPGDLLVASRSYYFPTETYYIIGFRCARSP